MTDREYNIAVIRDEALKRFYEAERRLGVDPLTAVERMDEFAKRFDALMQEAKLCA